MVPRALGGREGGARVRAAMPTDVDIDFLFSVYSA